MELAFVPPALAGPLPKLPGHAGGTMEALRKVAEEFEGMVLNQLLAPMFEGLETDGLGGGGAGEAMFRPMLLENYAKGMASSGGIGVADAVFRELVRMQGGGTDGVAG